MYYTSLVPVVTIFGYIRCIWIWLWPGGMSIIIDGNININMDMNVNGPFFLLTWISCFLTFYNCFCWVATVSAMALVLTLNNPDDLGLC